MKLGLYADPHLTQSSSIIVGHRGSFSGRLDNLIESFEWMNNLFDEYNVDKVVCLGDMTDKPDLTAEEITALGLCNVSNHNFVVGNHCRSDKSGKMNSLSTFDNVYYEPHWLSEDVLVLPYSSDKIDWNSLHHRPKIILSHNDILGYNFGGGKISSSGYEINEILDHCDLFINGHLHNGGWVVQDRIMNLGMLSGVNFASCGGEWEPSVAILDTDTLKIELFENPVAYKFKKQEFNTLPKLKKYLDSLDSNNYVLQVKVPSKISEQTRKLLDSNKFIVASRVLIQNEKASSTESTKFKSFEISNSSIYDKLRNFIKEDSKSKYNPEIIENIISELEKKEGAE